MGTDRRAWPAFVSVDDRARLCGYIPLPDAVDLPLRHPGIRPAGARKVRRDVPILRRHRRGARIVAWSSTDPYRFRTGGETTFDAVS